jgi:hypothetical protein
MLKKFQMLFPSHKEDTPPPQPFLTLCKSPRHALTTCSSIHFLQTVQAQTRNVGSVMFASNWKAVVVRHFAAVKRSTTESLVKCVTVDTESLKPASLPHSSFQPYRSLLLIPVLVEVLILVIPLSICWPSNGWHNSLLVCVDFIWSCCFIVRLLHRLLT